MAVDDPALVGNPIISRPDLAGPKRNRQGTRRGSPPTKRRIIHGMDSGATVRASATKAPCRRHHGAGFIR